MNESISNLSIQNYQDFKFSFQSSKKIFWDDENKKLIHPREYGRFREEITKKWLKMYLPNQFDIGTGFIVAPDGYTSTECDLIIYDKYRTPKIESIADQFFFPIETVAGIIEVKSDIQSIGDLKEALAKLAKIKEVRSKLKYQKPYKNSHNIFSPQHYPHDNIFTALICNEFQFDIKNYLGKFYDGTKAQYKHNFVLSLNDGLLCYKAPNINTLFELPFLTNVLHEDHIELMEFNNEIPKCIKLFLSRITSALNHTALLDIDMILYLSKEGEYFDGKIKK